MPRYVHDHPHFSESHILTRECKLWYGRRHRLTSSRKSESRKRAKRHDVYTKCIPNSEILMSIYLNLFTPPNILVLLSLTPNTQCDAEWTCLEQLIDIITHADLHLLPMPNRSPRRGQAVVSACPSCLAPSFATFLPPARVLYWDTTVRKKTGEYHQYWILQQQLTLFQV